MWPFKKKKIILSKKKYVDYLPVGTIVRLYNENNEYMIYRYLGNACMPFSCKSKPFKKSNVFNANNNTFYHADYAIMPYPTGDFSSTLYIMHEDIKETIYLGYDDEYRKNILNDIDTWNDKKGEINE